MKFLSQSFSRRTVSVSASSLLCVLFASVMAPNGTSNGLLRTKPSVELQVSKTLLTYPCPPDGHSASGSCPSTFDFQVDLTAMTKAFNKQTVYGYTVSGGRIVGEGSKVTWDLSEAGPGIFAATVEVKDNKKHRAISTVNVTVQNCGDCVISDFPCPMSFVTCYDEVKAGTPITCKVVVGPSTRSNLIAYKWSALDSSGDASERISGRGAYISIRTEGLGGQTVYTKVKVQGLDPSCSATASGSTVVKR